ncbi:hypothetical protein ABPG73_014536 [Tetrahymena malaccensis]
MGFKDLDQFSSFFQFNFDKSQRKEEPLLTERENYEHEDDEKVQNNNFSQVPNLETKSKLSIDERQNQYSYQLENKYKSINFDFINENSIDQLNEKNVSRLSMDNKYQQKHKLSFNIPQQSQKNKQKNTNNSYLTPNITSQQLNMLQINSQSQKNLTKEQKCLDVNASSHFYHKKTLDFTNKSPNQVQKTKQQQEMKNKFQKQIQILNQLQNNPLQKKLQQILFKSRICKKEIYLISKGLEPQTKQQIEDQVDKSLDIMHLYQDIIFLKKAVMILLNHEQLAAIQLVGFSSKLKDQTSNLNHFEEQFSIFESQEKQKKHIEIFLNRIISKQDQEEQDKENYAYQDDENNQNSKLAFAVPNLETKSKLSIDEKQNQFSFQVEDKQRSINIDNMNENSIDQFNEQKYLHQSMDSNISISKNVNYSEQEISISPKQLSSFKIQSQSQKKLMKAQNISEIEEKNLFQNKKTLSFTKNSSNQIKKTNEKQMLQNKYQKQTEFLNQLKNKPLLKKLHTFKDILKTNQLLENDNEIEDKHQEEIVQEETSNIQNQKLPLILQQKSNSIKYIDEKQHKFIFQEEKDKQKEISNVVNENNFGQTDQQKDQIQINNNKQKSQFQKYQKIRQFRFLQNIQKPQFIELETAISPSNHLLSEPQSLKANILNIDTSNKDANNQIQDKKLQHFQDSFYNQIQNSQQNKIMNKKQNESLNHLQNKSLLNKLQQILFKIKICGKQRYLISKGLQPKTKSIIEDQVSKSLDILNLYKDIILLKKAIMIILNNDQLAALQLVGISSDFSSKSNQLLFTTALIKDISLKINLVQNMNHFEEQFNILSSQKLQNKYIQIFFDRISSKKNLEAIDLKILSSIN